MALVNSMATADVLELARMVLTRPHKCVWSSYDEEADVLYINFKKPAVATDSELTDEDIIVRYEGEEVIGLTLLHARKRTDPRHCDEGPSGPEEAIPQTSMIDQGIASSGPGSPSSQ